jgi:hypothetical protein
MLHINKNIMKNLLILPHFCTCLLPGPRFPSAFVIVVAETTMTKADGNLGPGKSRIQSSKR